MTVSVAFVVVRRHGYTAPVAGGPRSTLRGTLLSVLIESSQLTRKRATLSVVSYGVVKGHEVGLKTEGQNQSSNHRHGFDRISNDSADGQPERESNQDYTCFKPPREQQDIPRNLQAQIRNGPSIEPVLSVA